MTPSHRHRLPNAVSFFVREAQCDHPEKLLKLLYLLDFGHFEKTGRSVTGLNYEAGPLGPQPRGCHGDGCAGSTATGCCLVPSPNCGQLLLPTSSRGFEEDFFTPRQLGLMTQLAACHRHARPIDLRSTTNGRGGPWHTVWCGGSGLNAPIPYALALRNPGDREELLRSAQEFQALGAH